MNKEQKKSVTAFFSVSVESSFYCHLLCYFKRNSAIYESLLRIVCGFFFLSFPVSFLLFRVAGLLAMVTCSFGRIKHWASAACVCLLFLSISFNRTNIQSPFNPIRIPTEGGEKSISSFFLSPSFDSSCSLHSHEQRTDLDFNMIRSIRNLTEIGNHFMATTWV